MSDLDRIKEVLTTAGVTFVVEDACVSNGQAEMLARAKTAISFGHCLSFYFDDAGGFLAVVDHEFADHWPRGENICKSNYT